MQMQGHGRTADHIVHHRTIGVAEYVVRLRLDLAADERCYCRIPT